jgi:hypothetical protein
MARILGLQVRAPSHIQVNQPNNAAINYRFIICRLDTAQHVSDILCPSSGAYQLQQQQPLVYRRNVVVAVLLAVVCPTTVNSTATTKFLR